jgi:ABC-type multidrug transport system permease subunit
MQASPYRNPNPLWQLTRVRVLEFLREPGALFWVFVFPVLLAMGLGIAFRHRPPDRALVVVSSAAPDARRVVRLLGQSAELQVKLMDEAAARRALRRGRADLVLEPAGGEPGYAYRYDALRVEGRTARLLADAALQRGLGRVDVVAVHDVRVTERGSRYIDFLIPGLLGLNLMGSSMWGLGFVIVNARTRKLLKRFAATPMHRAHYLLSFMFSRIIFLVPEVAVLVAFGWLVFGVAVRGSVLSLALVALVGGMSFLGLAVLVAARPRSTEAVSGWMNFIQLPMWLLSGSFFSYERFPEATWPLIRLLPLTALNDALRAVVNDGAALWTCWSQLLVLAAYGVLSFLLALRIFRWQ